MPVGPPARPSRLKPSTVGINGGYAQYRHLARELAVPCARCCTAELRRETTPGDATEVALLQLAASLGVSIDPSELQVQPPSRVRTIIRSPRGAWPYSLAVSSSRMSANPRIT